MDSNSPEGGRGVLPHKRLMGICRWIGSHFHDRIDYNGVAHFRVLGVRKFFTFTVSKHTRMYVL